MKEIIGKSNFKIKKLRHRIVIDEKEKYFSQVFDTMNYKILIRKLKKYGIKHRYIDWFNGYLNSWKQYAWYSEGAIPLKEVTCGVLRVQSCRGSITFSDIC